ncbi:MAG TPA: hypothetical protein PLL71_10135 [Agriterribacter sp.]|nr:hypothetical protein [Agriterribacter sp.]HRQ51609.1 hypothetical protein [Agriterribacter sp.]
MYRQVLLFSLLLIFSSCDPGYVVVLSNQSSKDKSIEVVLNKATNLKYKDSIPSIDSLGSFEKLKIPVSKDTKSNSYTFTLDKGKKAVLQQGIGRPDLDEKVIVDLTDTILLNIDTRIKIERHGISTSMAILLE